METVKGVPVEPLPGAPAVPVLERVQMQQREDDVLDLAFVVHDRPDPGYRQLRAQRSAALRDASFILRGTEVVRKPLWRAENCRTPCGMSSV
jgi:hypothetical protein